MTPSDNEPGGLGDNLAHSRGSAEVELLRELALLAKRTRELRTDARANQVAVKAAEGQSRSKWEQLRALRAGSIPAVRPRPDGAHRSRHWLRPSA